MKHYGKECNYYYNILNDGEYDAIVNTDMGFEKESFSNMDSCISWLAYYIEAQEWKPRWNYLQIKKPSGEIIKKYSDYNTLIEDLWRTLTDVNIDSDESTEQNWFIFPKGTQKEYIWHWFDERYSKGVAWLLHELEC